MQFIHLADTHLGYRQYGKIERMKDWMEATKQVIDYAIEKDVDFVVHSGDLFDSNRVDQDAFVETIDMLSSLKDAKIPFFVTDGNHDRRKGVQQYAINDILQMFGLCTYLHPDGIDLRDAVARIGGYNVVGLGYHGSYLRSRLPRLIEEIPDGKNIVLLHAGVEGRMEGERAEISVSELKELREKAVYLGLGHQHESFSVDNWAFNPGSVEREKFTRETSPKIFYDVSLEDDVPRVREIPIKTRRMYYIVVECQDDWGGVKDDIKRRISDCDINDSLLRIKIRGLLNDEFKRWEIEEMVRENGEPMLSDFVFDETHTSDQGGEWEGVRTNEIEEEILREHFGYYGDMAEEVTEFTLRFLDQILDLKPNGVEDAEPLAKQVSAWRRECSSKG
jgi:DNA repair exonuclease SbcCD nuclease subunit